jgi:hypothetical protein
LLLRLDKLCGSEVRPAKPDFTAEQKIEDILQAAHQLESDAGTCRAYTPEGREKLVHPGRGTLEKTADGFILSLLQARNFATDLNHSESASYHLNQHEGTISCLEQADFGASQHVERKYTIDLNREVSINGYSLDEVAPTFPDICTIDYA